LLGEEPTPPILREDAVEHTAEELNFQRLRFEEEEGEGVDGGYAEYGGYSS